VAWLVGGPLLVEAEDGVEAATFLLKVVGFGCEPEPALEDEHTGAGEPSHDEGGEVGAESINHRAGNIDARFRRLVSA
jgi:hypothetical protein